MVRGGPGLGNIAASQGDYYQSVKGGGHGDYHTIVLAPNSVDEMGNFPKKCYELAEKYRMPAMILADGILGQMMEPVEFKFTPVDPATLKKPDWSLGNAAGRKKRIVRSYDLREGELEKMNWARAKKFQEIEDGEVQFEEKNIQDAQLVLVAYGTSSRIAAAAMKMARDKGLKVGLFRPITLWPFPKKQLAKLAQRVENFLVVEMSQGQFVDDVRLAVNGTAQVDLYARPAGIPSGEEVFAVVEKLYQSIKPALAAKKVEKIKPAKKAKTPKKAQPTKKSQPVKKSPPIKKKTVKIKTAKKSTKKGGRR